MQGLSNAIDRFDNAVGNVVAWLVLPMVLIQFALVLVRYVFGTNSIWFQESVLYLHALSFMLGAAAVLLRNRHVRVDIFYANLSARHKAMVDLFGICAFLVPVMVLIIVVNVPTALNAWRVLEGSAEGSGIRGVFLLKSLPVAMAFLLILQGFSIAVRAILVLMDRLDTHLAPTKAP